MKTVAQIKAEMENDNRIYKEQKENMEYEELVKGLLFQPNNEFETIIIKNEYNPHSCYVEHAEKLFKITSRRF